MAEFWNSLTTEKSWKILTDITRDKFEFIVIGGWAAYLWSKLHKSKDIDIALIKIEDLEYLRSKYELKKNDRLKKYEISFEEIDLDIYVPYYSQLAIPIEDLKRISTKIEGINVPKPEALLILKQGAEEDRSHSIKGQKDQLDIMTLLCYTDVNFKFYNELLNRYKLNPYYDRLIKIVSNFKDYQYLNLNPRKFKLKKEEILEKMKKER